MVGAEAGHVSKNVSSEGDETDEEPEEDPEEAMDEEPEEDPEEEEIDTENEEDPEEDPEEEEIETDNEEDPEEDPEEEEIETDNEEDPEEEEIDTENEEDPVEDQEEEINEESYKEELPVENSHLLSATSGGIASQDCGNELSKDPEGKNGKKVVEASGSSGRKRQSRWDLQWEGETRQIDGNSKRRKTRWDNNDTKKDSFDSAGITNGLDLLKDRNVLSLKERLLETNKKLISSTCSAKKREKLINKSKLIISKLAKANLRQPTRSFVKKILVPVKEYPTYNFIGLILGPKGSTQKKMEKETGAKILLRGKGSGESGPLSDEELHVLVEAYNQRSLDAAVAMVEKLLIPVADENNDHKRAQLVELAKQRGTYKDKNICDLCKEQGHRKYACPLQESTFEAVCCDVCGSFGHLTLNCSVQRKLQESSGTVVDQTNLYVGYLSHEIDEQRLKELFLPFGKIEKTAVLRDLSTGLSKGYGFVKFEDPSDSAAAVTYMNGYKMNGKMLAVRVAGKKPVSGPPSQLGHHPNIVGPVYVPAVPMLPEASNEMNGSLGFPSSLSYCGPDSHIARTEASNISPYVVTSTTNNFSSGYDFCDRIPSLLPNSESVIFPGHPDYIGSQFNSYFTNPVMNETLMAEPEKKSATYSFASRFRG
ncbi:hypothetical protein ABFS82_06G035000 [Erythranthe guttata]|uniref:Branchpoint-bridging protein n=2 Tax=Erythranthe guttata TaxID=4155 RepID=A0A022Q8T3_ERYGU|nr:PREDICTED: splicing factor U2af large subunit A-like isoform X2 [Erythranthe guttata]XP_012852178.1 PREDICTED: splicing factor U2af large subunit A-like isoform X2 [Erythranthe guttata]EYU25082.1 hypothetical protein MIMGU_mgv1a020680mg [Erythranthe guttata]|eukprot:XP_012852177.1 PREDICTED: splicing factor U2af large subunit A-like isoform X2 [Erythranthe guttata]